MSGVWFPLAATAVLVNVAFTVRFRDYLDTVQQGRAEQLAAAFAADYARDGGRRAASLDRLAPSVSMVKTPPPYLPGCAVSAPEPLLPRVRRRTASTWATSSRGLNGLTR